MTDWDAVRALVDEIGMRAVEEVVAGPSGVTSELAGQRVAKFNDMFIEKLKAKEAESGQ